MPSNSYKCHIPAVQYKYTLGCVLNSFLTHGLYWYGLKTLAVGDIVWVCFSADEHERGKCMGTWKKEALSCVSRQRQSAGWKQPFVGSFSSPSQTESFWAESEASIKQLLQNLHCQRIEHETDLHETPGDSHYYSQRHRRWVPGFPQQ